METRWFLVMDGALVTGHITASNADWSAVVTPPTLLAVDQTTFWAVVVGSTRNPDGSFTPPPAQQ